MSESEKSVSLVARPSRQWWWLSLSLEKSVATACEHPKLLVCVCEPNNSAKGCKCTHVGTKGALSL